MLSFDLNQKARRLEDFDVQELEGFIQRGRTLQARAMGQGLKALFSALVFGKRPAAARTEQGKLDWEKVLGVGSPEAAAGARR